MQQQFDNHIFTGMQRDLSSSKHPANYLFDALNIRITAGENNTLLSITNERGPKDLSIQVSGNYLGHCILNQYLVVFSTTSTTRNTDGSTTGQDYITRINIDAEIAQDEGKVKVLYDSTRGNLGFCTSNPVEAISSYENANILKVYWTDGYNLPRFINISPTLDDILEEYALHTFDFVPELQLQEEVVVNKILGAGEFPPGVIQYALTYFNKYGLESNIFYTTPLQYISFLNRGGSPEEKVANTFTISVADLDTNFDYVRIYSILRTSLNGTPITKKVDDIAIPLKIVDAVGTSMTTPVEFIDSKKESTIKLSLNKGAFFKDLPLKYKKTLSKSDLLGKPVVEWRNSIQHPSERFNEREWESFIMKTLGVKVNAEGIIIADETSTNLYQGFVKISAFSKRDFQNIVLLVGGKYYTWTDHINTNAVLYVVESFQGSVVKGKYQVLTFLLGEGETFLSVLSCYTQLNLILCSDDGIKGEDVTPTELLYKERESIAVQTIELKDNTLFLGNIKLLRQHLDILQKLLDLAGVTSDNPLSNSIYPQITPRPYIRVANAPFTFISTLQAPSTEEYQGCLTFKSNEYYRLGIQFQYKDGKWTEPYWIGDSQCTVNPLIYEDKTDFLHPFDTPNIGIIYAPEFIYNLSSEIVNEALSKGYRKVRPVYAIPQLSDKTILCLGIGCSTVYRNIDRYEDTTTLLPNFGPLYAQSSWLFRTKAAFNNDIPNYNDLRTYNMSEHHYTGAGKVSYLNGERLKSQYESLWLYYTSSKSDTFIESPFLRSTEVMGIYDDDNAFRVDTQFLTFHSPDVLWDDSFMHMDFYKLSLKQRGLILLKTTYGDIDIQTATPAVSSKGEGIITRTITANGDAALISGFFYKDFVVDDTKDTPKYEALPKERWPVYWPVYMWHKNGSLNNDVARTGRSAELLKKKISNYRYSDNTVYNGTSVDLESEDMLLFSSDLLSILKINGLVYKGNIEAMVTPTEESPYYIGGDPFLKKGPDEVQFPTFLSACLDRLYLKRAEEPKDDVGLLEQLAWDSTNKKYIWKSTSTGDSDAIGNYVKDLASSKEAVSIKYKSTAHLVSKVKQDIYKNLAAGELPLLEVTKDYDKDIIFGGTSKTALLAAIWIPCGPAKRLETPTNGILLLEYKWGDSYIQRFECLKTYAFTPEDKNQVIEVASFVCESRMNLDGRYDRNKGQLSNLNSSPINFNLFNLVYNQLDNFFTYRILDEDYYKIYAFPNQVTWSLAKLAGAAVDLWTNITLANTYDLDGSKGYVQSLNTWKDEIYCFLDKGISNILFNSRVQIPASDGVPIEITNSYKVDGYRYITDGTGCVNKSTIKETATGIYFIDSITHNLYHIGDGVSDISTTHNMTTWFKENEVVKTLYDDVYHDVYLIGNTDALCYSEVMKEFTSRVSYHGISLLESYGNNVFTMHSSKLYQFRTGDYNMFFGTFKPWFINFISNGVSNQANNSTIDKVFENLEYRMDRYSYNSTLKTWNNEHLKSLDYIRVYNEYQDTGYVNLELTLDRPSNLKKKFRIWRVNIPRNKAIKDSRDIYKSSGKRDRIRNTWCNIELGIRNLNTDKVEMHDMNVIYYV